MTSGIAVTDANFEAEVLQSSLPVVLDFWASWCGPCRMMSPVLEELAQEYAGRIKIVKVNIDEAVNLANQHMVSSIPTLVIYKNGVILRQKSGAMPKSQIVDFFKDLL